jgi:CheY-like chemotaxis protein
MNEKAKPIILCVDDDKRILDLLKVALEPEGHDLRFAQSGEDAVKQIFAQLPDLILLDITMPGTSGMDVLKKIMTDEAARSVPVIMLTASQELEDARQAMKLGAVSYICKPFKIEMLRSIISGFLPKGNLY